MLTVRRTDGTTATWPTADYAAQAGGTLTLYATDPAKLPNAGDARAPLVIYAAGAWAEVRYDSATPDPDNAQQAEATTPPGA